MYIGRAPSQQGLSRERAFFERHYAYRSLAARCGTGYLTRALSGMLFAAIRAHLPALRSQLAAMRLQLAEERRAARAYKRQQEEDAACSVCLDAPKDSAMLPCRHRCVCAACAADLLAVADPRCPICRAPAASHLQLFG